MKRFLFKFIILLLIFNFLFNCMFIPLNVYASQNTVLTKKQEAIVNIANAYYSQGVGIQYDQKRRFMDVKPEEAKDRWPIYLDCSSFVYNVYLQAFGVELNNLSRTAKQMDEAYNNRFNTSYIPYYKDYPNSISKTTLLNILNDKLQVGDLLVYRRYSGSGHVLLYLGDGVLIHCTGKYYDFDEKKDYRESAGILKTTLKDYVSYFRSTNVAKFAVIRPLKSSYLKNASLTEYAIIKNEVPKLDIVAASSPGNLKTVNLGSTVTYTFYLKNKDKEKNITDIIVKQKVSDYLTVKENSFVTTLIETQNGVTVEKDVILPITVDENNNLYAKIDNISPNTKIAITYKAKVTTDESNLGKVITSQFQAGKLINGNEYFEGTNTIKLTIGHTLTSTERNTLVETAKKLEGKSYDGKTRNLIDDIYFEAFKVDTKLGKTSVKTMLSQIITTDKNGNLKLNTDKSVLDTKARKTLIPEFYGYTKDSKIIATTGTRYLDPFNLRAGDVIIYSRNDKYYIYLYLSETELMTISDGKVTIKNDVQKRFDSIIGYDQFAVLRPSLDF